MEVTDSGTRTPSARYAVATVVGYVTRPTLFIAFAAFLYVAGYRPSGGTDTYIGLARTIVEATVAAANDGYPLMAYVPDYVPNRVQSPVPIDRLSSGYVDAGLPMLTSMVASLGRSIRGPSFRLDISVLYRIVYGLLLLSAGIFLLPNVPLPIGLGGIVALGWGALAGPLATTAFTGALWFEVFGATLVAVLVAVSAAPPRGRSHWLFVVVLGALIAFCQFLRQEAAVTMNLVAIVALASTWLIAGLAGLVMRDRTLWASTVGGWVTRITLAFGVVGVLTIAAPSIVRGIDAWVWNVPYSETQEPLHGAGHNLYLGLGYVDNPYNISWRDQVGRINEALIRPDVPIEDHRYQDVLRDEWLRVVTHSPWLLADNVRAKLADVFQAFVVGQQLGLALVGAAVIALASLGLCLKIQSPSLFVTLTGFAALWLATALVPLLVFPDYSAGVRGSLLATICVLPGVAFAANSNSGDPWIRLPGLVRRQILALAFGMTAVVAALAIGGATLAWQSAAQQQRAETQRLLTDSSPASTLLTLGYRFDEQFNVLRTDDQQHILALLRGSKQAYSFAPVDANIPGELSYFKPQLAIVDGGQIHLFVWLGPDVNRPTYKDQGNATLFVRYCFECTTLPDRFSNDIFNIRDAFTSKDVTGINDSAWRGTYRAISLPAAPIASPARFLRVGLEAISSWNGVDFQLAPLGSTALLPVAQT